MVQSPHTTPDASQDYGITEQLPDQEDFWRPPTRFGAVPVETEPLGWDRRHGFLKHYPRVNLPTQIVERVSFGRSDDHEPNRLIWGDNLHVMRQLPSKSVDLIYIDPPFFSGRQYNVLWGDNNEVRSFNDIWEDGMPGYLTWLNARLYEMKRLLKDTGSIYVHCDWHASHYIKVELDKIFGYQNFRNEVVWKRRAEVHNLARKNMGRIHDVIFYYVKTEKASYRRQFTPYSEDYINRHYRHSDNTGRYTTMPCTNEAGGNRPYNFRGIVRAWRFTPENMEKMYQSGLLVQTAPGRAFRYKKYLKDADGVPLQDFWDDIPPSRGGEAIGYPTQKPEGLAQRIIRASSDEGDIVFDPFLGGGTTAVAAQRLRRRWIGCDQSRVAIAVTAERLKQEAVQSSIIDSTDQESDPLDFTVEHWGVYEATQLAEMPPDEFRAFTLHSYGATRISDDDGPHIHGWHNNRPVWVGQPGQNSPASATDVGNFANAILQTTQYRDAFLRDGTMLAWGFHPDARTAADNLRQREGIQVQFVRLQQIRIGSTDFREHVVGQSTDRADYSDFLTFVHPPNIDVGYRNLGNGSVTFDASGTAVINSDAEIINVQWDFNHRNRFEATPGYSFQRDRNKKPSLQVTHKFDRLGSFNVACRIQDSKGGEGTHVIKVEVR